MRVDILSSGLESRQTRGYESASRGLFELLNDNPDYETILYKGSGDSLDNEIVLGFLSKGFFTSLFKGLFKGDFYGSEYFVFTLFYIIRSLVFRNKVDFIYSQEPRVILTIRKLRFLIPKKTQIIFGLGNMISIDLIYNIADKIHFVNYESYSEAQIKYPQLNSNFFLIPNYITDIKKYKGKLNKDSLKLKYDVITDNVVISVGVINRNVKRMDYVVNEVSKLNSSWTLILIGEVEDDSIIRMGKGLMGDRFKYIKVTPELIGELFALSDVSVLASLIEGFGNVVTESMLNNTPVLVHDRPLNDYIVGEKELLLDMTKENALYNRLNSFNKSELESFSQVVQQRYETKFSKSIISCQYFKLFNNK